MELIEWIEAHLNVPGDWKVASDVDSSCYPSLTFTPPEGELVFQMWEDPDITSERPPYMTVWDKEGEQQVALLEFFPAYGLLAFCHESGHARPIIIALSKESVDRRIRRKPRHNIDLNWIYLQIYQFYSK